MAELLGAADPAVLVDVIAALDAAVDPVLATLALVVVAAVEGTAVTVPAELAVPDDEALLPAPHAARSATEAAPAAAPIARPSSERRVYDGGTVVRIMGIPFRSAA